MANKNTDVVTGIVRLSYANIWEPKPGQNGGAPKYSCSLIIPKTDRKTIDAINAAVEAALTNGVGKFGGKIPPRGQLKLPLRDGDTDRDDDAYKGCMFVNASAGESHPPKIVDRMVKPILDRSEVYSGCYARVAIQFYAFNQSGNKGVACGLLHIQKIRDGEPLGGTGPSVDSVFTPVEDEDDFGL